MTRSFTRTASRLRKGLATALVTGLIASGAALIIPTSASAAEDPATPQAASVPAPAAALPTPVITAYAPITEFTYGEPISVGAVLTPSHISWKLPSGTVWLSDGTTMFASTTLDRFGLALFEGVIVPVTATEIYVVYDGDDRFGEATSAPIAVSIAPADTSIEMYMNTNEVRAGDLVTIQFVVQSDASSVPFPHGTIELLVDGEVFDSVVVDGEAEPNETNNVSDHIWQIATLPAGEHQISGRFIADLGFVDSESGSETLLVTPWATTITATSAPETPRVGDDVTITASVTLDEADTIESGDDIPIAWGTIQAFIDGIPVGKPVDATEVPSVITLTGLGVGDHEVLLVFLSENDRFEATETLLTVTVAPAIAPEPEPAPEPTPEPAPVPAPKPIPASSSNGTGSLATTGTSTEFWPLAGGALLVAGALLLMVRRRARV